MARTIALVTALLLWCSCGGDDDTDDAGAGAIDGATDEVDGAPDEIDAAAAGGTQEIGQFCGTLPDGEPTCVAGLDCCSDNVCREPTDCEGSAGYVPCDQASDCNNVCCETDSMTFCTKPSACDAYGGMPID